MIKGAEVRIDTQHAFKWEIWRILLCAHINILENIYIVGDYFTITKIKIKGWS